jgi:NADPH2:quinone reductase
MYFDFRKNDVLFYLYSQIGKEMGATVIAVCSTQEKLDMAKANGAYILINYTKTDLKTVIKDVTDGKGVDVVYECVGGHTFHACSRSMAWSGRLLVVGFAGGTIPEFLVNLALVKGYSEMVFFWARLLYINLKTLRQT